MIKNCRACKKQLARKKGESSFCWNKRVCCGIDCRYVLLNQHRKARRIPCVGGCGRKLKRFCTTNVARCHKCHLAQQAAYTKERQAVMLEQSRRYRLLMTTLGWEDFGECLEYLKSVPWTQLSERTIRNLRSAA